MQKLLDQLKIDEGFSEIPYKDTEGYLTIGYGTMIERITRAEAELLLQHRMQVITRELVEKKPVINDFPEEVQLAVLNMAYNLGVPKLLKFVKMWKALEDKNWGEAASQAEWSNWYVQVGDRAKRVVGLMRSAV